MREQLAHLFFKGIIVFKKKITPEKTNLGLKRVFSPCKGPMGDEYDGLALRKTVRHGKSLLAMIKVDQP